jgi:DNA-binding winged helix-turn-helix (wHTH) protein
MEVVRPQSVVQFGIFELDLRAEELRKSGVKVKLRGQPFQVLKMLLERPGEIVTREEIQKQLWPDGTFVDFDHGLNLAINRIREVLNDSATAPRFVETIPRRGYRFIAPIERADGRSAGEPPSAASIIGRHQNSELRADLKHLKRDTDSGRVVVSPAGADSGPAPGVHPRSHWQIWTVAAGVAALISLGTLGYWLKSPLPPPKVLRYSQITSDGQQKLFFSWYDNSFIPAPIFTDGSRLYFHQLATGGPGDTISLFQASVAGGEILPVRTPFPSAQLADLSPNRSELLVVSLAGGEREAPLWVLSALGGSPRRLSEVTASDATWTPDGQQITYTRGSEIHQAKTDGSQSRK